MPDRTEREKLVEAMKRRALARIDPVLRPDHDCREREPDLPGSWCSWCMVLAAADLLSEEGEPDTKPLEMWLCESVFVYLKPDQPYVFRVDQGCPSCQQIARAGEVRLLGREPAPIRPGPVQEASDGR